MMPFKSNSRTVVSALLLVTLAGPVWAHCDSMEGPVVADAQRALDQKSVDPVLKWISEEDTDAVRQTFEMTLAVRDESEAARTIADRYFFETLVRLHRASEGEGFTGLKPAGSVEPGIAAADRALEVGKIEPLADQLAEAVRRAVMDRFQAADTARQTAEDSVAEGREFVAAYVQFTHFVEQVDDLVAEGASHQHRESLDAMSRDTH